MVITPDSVSWVRISIFSAVFYLSNCFATGRRVISAYLCLLLSSSPNLKPSDDVEAIVSRTLNTYVLGEHIGSRWGLGRVMRWTPTLKADRVKDADVALLKGAGLYKVQGDAVAAVIGGIFEQFVCFFYATNQSFDFTVPGCIHCTSCFPYPRAAPYSH